MSEYDLKTYFGWLVRESFRQVRIKPFYIEEVFTVGLNYWDWRSYAPDTLSGCKVLLTETLREYEIVLMMTPDDSVDKSVVSFLKEFYDLQDIYPFTGDSWRSYA